MVSESVSAPGQVPGPARFRALLVICAAVFMLMLDVTVVMVALVDIQRDIGGDLAALQWVVDGYATALAALMLTAATAADRIGRRRVFTIGLVVFTVASAGCALAVGPLTLNLVRVVQGAGAAMLFGTALPLIAAGYPDGRDRSTAMAAYGATLSGATALGPLVGGFLVGGPGWRWIFVMNLPIGLAALVAARGMTESRPVRARAVDWWGTALLVGTLITLLLGLIRSPLDGWTSIRVLALLTAAFVLAAGFVGRELTVPEPMLDFALFRRRRFSGVSLAAFAVSASLIASAAYLLLYLQVGLGFSPWATGLRILPMTVAAFVAAPITGALMSRVRLELLASGSLLLVGIGMLVMSRSSDGSWASLLPGLVPAGIGLGISGTALAGGALTTVEPARAGAAAGTVNTLRQVGIGSGIAALGSVFQAAAPEGLTGWSGPVLISMPPGGRAALAAGLNDVMSVGGWVALGASVACFLLIRQNSPVPQDPSPGQNPSSGQDPSPGQNLSSGRDLSSGQTTSPGQISSSGQNARISKNSERNQS